MTSAKQVFALGADLGGIWSTPSTSDRDRKALAASADRRGDRRGAAAPQPAIPTDGDTIALPIRLAAHYDDDATAGVLNRRRRRSATGKRFTAIIVAGPRRYLAFSPHRALAPERLHRAEDFRSLPARGVRPMEARAKHWAGPRPLVLRPLP
jgi:hypothetical protein